MPYLPLTPPTNTLSLVLVVGVSEGACSTEAQFCPQSLLSFVQHKELTQTLSRSDLKVDDLWTSGRSCSQPLYLGFFPHSTIEEKYEKIEDREQSSCDSEFIPLKADWLTVDNEIMNNNKLFIVPINCVRGSYCTLKLESRETEAAKRFGTWEGGGGGGWLRLSQKYSAGFHIWSNHFPFEQCFVDQTFTKILRLLFESHTYVFDHFSNFSKYKRGFQLPRKFRKCSSFR